MFVYLFFGLLIVIALFALMFGHRIYHGYVKKRDTVNTYAIQSTAKKFET